MHFHIEFEQETDRGWIAEVVELPGALALRIVANRLENEEAGSEFLEISFTAA